MLLNDILNAGDILQNLQRGQRAAQTVTAEQEQIILINLNRTFDVWICLFQRITETAGDDVVVRVHECLLFA